MADAGESVTIGCNEACTPAQGRCEGNPMIRICNSARPCAGTACNPPLTAPERLPFCSHTAALAANDDSCGNQCSLVTFTCPANGYYRVLTGGFHAGEASTCRLPFAM